MSATGGTNALSANIQPTTSSRAAIQWKSSDTAVVTVSETGVITPVGVGKASITATASGVTSEPCEVTVSDRFGKTYEFVYTQNGAEYEVGCRGYLSGNISIPSSDGTQNVTAIAAGAFRDCTEVTSFEIPNTIVSIGKGAFENCTGLTKIKVPKSVTSIGEAAFKGCSLSSVNLPFVGANREAANSVQSVFGYIFGYSNTSKAGTTMQVYKTGSSAYYYIPDSLTDVTITDANQLPFGAFNNCRNIRFIYVNNEVESIGNNSFYSCVSLENIHVPTKLTSLGEYSFYQCTSLQDIFLYSELETMGDHAFENCTSLTKADMPLSMERIGRYAFAGCEALSFANFPLELKTLGERAFRNCASLTFVVLPGGITSFGDYAFEGCAALETVGIGGGTTSVGRYAFADCAKIYHVSFGNGMKWIKNNAFMNCSALPGITFLYDTLETIDDEAFKNCTALAEIELPDSLQSIGRNAFAGCTGVKEIKIPFVGAKRTDTEYTSLGYAFPTAGIKKVMITDQEEIPDGAFFNCTSLESVSIRNATKYICNGAFLLCTALSEVELSDNLLSLGYNDTDSVQYGYNNGVFFGCTNLKTIKLPDSITQIGSCAFSRCTALQSITLPENLEIIRNNAFDGCSALGQINFQEKLSIIYRYAFQDCVSLKSVVLPDSVTGIEKGIFNGCYGLTSISIPFVGDERNYTYKYAQGSDVFTELFGDHATNATYVNQFFRPWASGVECQTGGYVPNSLTTVTVTDASVLAYGAFENCGSITTLSLNGEITSIYNTAFDSCNSALKIYAPAGSSTASLLASRNLDIRDVAGEHVSEIYLDGPTEIGVGRSGQLTAVVKPDYAPDKQLTWSSDASEIAEVDADGLVTGIAPGTAVIRAQSGEPATATAEYTISVKQYPVYVRVTEYMMDMSVGQEKQLVLEISPASLTNIPFEWSSDNEYVASVNEHGIVTAKHYGLATICAMAKDGSNRRGFCLVSVAPVKPSSLQITFRQGDKIICTGDSLESLRPMLTVDVINNDGSVIKDVNDYELIGKLSAGECEILAMYDYAFGRFIVNVEDSAPTGIRAELDPDNDVVYTNTELQDLRSQLIVTMINASGAVCRTVTGYTLEWEKPTDAASVYGQGSIVAGRALTEGTHTLNISYEGFATQLDIYVNAVIPSSASLGTDKSVRVRFDKASPDTAMCNDTIDIVTTEGSFEHEFSADDFIVSAEKAATAEQVDGVVVIGIGQSLPGSTMLTISVTKSVKLGSAGLWYNGVRIGTIDLSIDIGNFYTYDFNDDGIIDDADVILILNSIVGDAALSEAQRALADMNEDGHINNKDVVILLRNMASPL